MPKIDDFDLNVDNGLINDLIERHGSAKKALESLNWRAIRVSQRHLIERHLSIAEKAIDQALTTVKDYDRIKRFIESNKAILTKNEYKLLNMHYNEGLSRNEMAIKLNISYDAVRFALKRYKVKYKL